jgi:adenylate kinase family enzyme
MSAYDRAVQRVSIVGPGGTGKTTIALEIGRRLGMPVVHLDRLYWQPGARTGALVVDARPRRSP